MSLKAKKRSEDAPAKKENRWADNRTGLMGFICAITGLVVFPLPFGVVAVFFGYRNKTRETISLWKLILPVGVFNILFGIVMLSGLV